MSRIAFAALASASLIMLGACAAPSSDDDATEDVSQDFSQGVTTTTVLRDGRLVVKLGTPALTSSCRTGERCTDVDEDGLVDRWEDALLDRLRPRMALHPQEPLITDPSGRFGYVARVFRPESGPSDIVRVIIVTGFSYDPGVLLFGKWPVSAHDGDSERVALELTLEDDGREAIVKRAYFAVHEYTPNDQTRLYATSELADALTFGKDPNGQPRWVVFPSKGKHPEFANPKVCNATSLKGTGIFAEHCAASEAESHPILPAIVNAGESSHHRVDDLATVGFPNDEAWVEQDFCGGLRAHPLVGKCVHESVASKLLDDPFARRPH